jgi:hypothetical protein
VKISAAEITDPVNNFMSFAPVPTEHREGVLPSEAEISPLNSAVLGLDHGAFASNPGRVDHRDERGRPDGRARRLSRACVIKKNLAWSGLGQYYCLNFGGRKPGTGIAAQGRASGRPGLKARPFAGTLNARA